MTQICSHSLSHKGVKFFAKSHWIIKFPMRLSQFFSSRFFFWFNLFLQVKKTIEIVVGLLFIATLKILATGNHHSLAGRRNQFYTYKKMLEKRTFNLQVTESLLLTKYSWVPNRRVYSFIWHQRNMKKETDTKTDKSI